MRRPPTVATWLLRYFGCSPQTEHVIGDLVEKYQEGRSRSWYWWQVAIAIVVAFFTEIRLNKLVVLRGLLVGSAFLYLFVFSISYIASRWLQHAWEHPRLLLVDIGIVVVACAISGWLVARSHYAHRRVVVFAFIVWQFLPLLIPVRIPLFPSWIFAVGRTINVLLWNSYGMTALNEFCSSCATQWYAFLIATVSVPVVVMSLLVGSGVLGIVASPESPSRIKGA